MARFRLQSLGELARQMLFASPGVRLRQIDAAEALLHDIESAKAYPPDFIIYRITGYRPKETDGNLLTGLALRHDLGLLIEQVADSLDLRTVDLAEPVLSLDEVTERFNVTSKTIQRWRRKGLAARRFQFPDGKRRVGFLLSTVERFLRANGEQVARGGNFSQVDDVERDEILRRARRLATMCHCCRHEIARRIARTLNRSPLTILHTVKKFDDEHPDQAIFAEAAADLDPGDRLTVVRGHRRGVPIRALARRICRSRAEVYRIILEERLNRLLKKKMRFFDDPLYHQADATDVVAAIARAEALPEPATEPNRIPRDLPAYLRELYRVPLLTPGGERGLFLQHNFHKYQFISLRRRVDVASARARDLNRLDSALRRVIESRNALVAANLRLVVSVAKKHLRPGLDLMELVSEGNLILLRAVDSFDMHRGTRFSTYATLALMKGFARSVPQLMRPTRAVSADSQVLDGIEDSDRGGDVSRWIDREQVGQLLSLLNARERGVLAAHYGLDGDRGARTYEQLGAEFGLSKQRVRQIEQAALAKLRAASLN